MKILKTIFSVALFALFSASSQAQYSPDTYMVIFEPGTTQVEIDVALDDLNSTELWVSPISETRLWQVDSFPFNYPPTGELITDINETDKKSQERPETQGGGLNYATFPILNTTTAPPYPNYKDEQLDCQGQLSTYISNESEPIDVGVFDTGLTYFGNPNIPEYYFDLEGYSEYDNLDDDPIAQDDHGHGTHMASIISHTINKSYGTGQSNQQPNEGYNIRRVFDVNGEGYLAEIIRAMEQATLEGMQVANCSWSFEATESDALASPLYTSLSLLESIHGILIIASAGNDGKNMDNGQIGGLKNYPAAYELPNILTATTYDCSNDLASFANYGAESVDIALPGFKIPGLDETGNLYEGSGTSQSAAILAGIAATLGTHQKVFDYEEIICAIMSSAIYTQNLKNKVKSEGLITAEGALNLLGNCSHNPQGPGGVKGRSRNANTTKIYPSPTSGEVNISYESILNSEFVVTIHNMHGGEILSENHAPSSGNSPISYDLSLYPAGMYTLTIQDGEEYEVHKLLIKN